MNMNMLISAATQVSHVAAFSEDGPGCGTLPPGWHPTGPGPTLHASRLDAVALNPQPIPPGKAGGGNFLSSLLDAVALNPQPLPPGEAGGRNFLSSLLDAVALNPQPLPPGEAGGGALGSTHADVDDIPLCPPPRPHPWSDLVGPASLSVLQALGVSHAQPGQDRGIIIVSG